MKIHLMGIGGSGMNGVAHIATQMGYEVTGCDLEDSTAYAKNIFKGHSPTHLKDIDYLIVSPAVLYQNSDNPELVEAQKRKIVMTWQEFLGEVILKDKKVICIAGTHGKSTTTAMVGKLLIDNGFDPIIVLGANVPEWGGSSRFGKGEYAVIEADEFNNNFLHYHPDIAVINNIEFDHPDFFKNEDEVKESFSKFIQNLVGQKLLITEKDSLSKKFNLKIFGDHNQKNANMVFLLGKKLGISEEKIIESIESFNGIGRRMELIGERGGVKVYDDYAHHPTAIKTTLEGVRQKYPKTKILVIVEPHGYKRTKALLPLYKDVFDSVDKVFIGPIFQARDEVDTSVTPELVAKTSRHKNISYYDDANELIRDSRFQIQNSSYDVVVIMGAGKSYLWAREIANSLPVTFSDLTTFHIGGKIEKYLEIKNKEEVPSVVALAKKSGRKIFIIGGGSDILASDEDFNDIVLRYVGEDISFKNDDTVIAEAGTKWDRLVEFAVDNNLQGMECLSGIPGTVGASPIQNIGAYGQEMSETFESLEAFNIEKEKFVTFSKKDCKFGYRESIFKTPEHWQKYVICNVTFKLNKNGKLGANYESLSKYLLKNPTLGDIRNAIIKTRNEKLENPKEIGNAGSFFKNPIIDLDTKKKLEEKYADVKIYPFEDRYKIPAGWLIEKAGWKGKRFKSAGVSTKHALILINADGHAKAKDVYDLSEKIINDVYEKFGVKMEREVQLVNF